MRTRINTKNISTALFYLMVVIFSLGQLGRVSFFGQQVNIYLYEILVLLVLLVLLGKYRFKPVFYFFHRYKIIFIFFIVLLISYILNIFAFSLFENIVGLLYFIRLLTYFLSLIYLWFHVQKDRGFGGALLKSLYLLFFLIAISSIIQYFFYPELRNLSYLGWDPHLYRLFGVFLDSSVAAAVYGLILIYIYLDKSNGTNRSNRIVRYGFMGVFFVFLVLTFSRTAYIAATIAFLYLFFTKRKVKEMIFFSVLFVTILFFAPKPFGESVNLVRTFSISSRLEDYKSALKIWSKKPLLGYGYNRIRYVKKKLNIIEGYNSDTTHSGASFHSSYLIILTTGGIIGLIFYILSLLNLFRLSRNTKYYLLFLGVMSLLDNILLHPFILFLLFILLVGDS